MTASFIGRVSGAPVVRPARELLDGKLFELRPGETFQFTVARAKGLDVRGVGGVATRIVRTGEGAKVQLDVTLEVPMDSKIGDMFLISVGSVNGWSDERAFSFVVKVSRVRETGPSIVDGWSEQAVLAQNHRDGRAPAGHRG